MLHPTQSVSDIYGGKSVSGAHRMTTVKRDTNTVRGELCGHPLAQEAGLSNWYGISKAE